jgi:hypothetical protein
MNYRVEKVRFSPRCAPGNAFARTQCVADLLSLMLPDPEDAAAATSIKAMSQNP